MFTEKFSGYAGETIECERNGLRFVATLKADDDATSPWEREDGHGPVSDWQCHGINGYASKAPGERPLSRGRNATLFYDFAEAVRIARRDGWGAPAGHFKPDATPTPGQVAHAAAMADYERLRRWCDGHWDYVGVCVVAYVDDVQLTADYGAALWGIESDAGDYLTATANELLAECETEAREVAATIAERMAATA